MDDLEALRDRLKQEKGRWREVEKGSGVPYSSLCKFAQRQTENPGARNLLRLMAYFRDKVEA